MTFDTFLTALIIAGARIVDVSLGTLRTMFVIRGRREIAAGIGFIEVLIWVLAVSKVITQLDNPVYAVAFAVGFSVGSFVGMTIERWLAHGEQVLRAFTRNGEEVAGALRAAGHRVTQFEGKGLAGPVTLLFVKASRREVPKIIASVRALDPDCFYTVDDVRLSSSVDPQLHEPAHWRGVAKKK